MGTIQNSKIKTIIFDLDGTLIDSAPSILAGLDFSIKKAGISPVLPLSSSLVGPPLRETLSQLVGNGANINLDALVLDFKAYYDSEGYKVASIYPGIDKLLNELFALNIPLYIATNKRFEPTQKIINYFNWSLLFNDVYAIDKFTDTDFRNKATMIQALVKAKSIDKSRTVYVGDRMEDFEAATENGLSAILVNWGYGVFDVGTLNRVQCARSAQELLEMILGGS